MNTRTGIALLALAALIGGCAGPNTLVRKSREAYDSGNDRKAYDFARRAMDKEPQLASAREAYRAAASRVATNWKERIRNLATADSLDAARQCLQLTEFRKEVARYGVALPTDPAWGADENRLRDHAAAHYYREGMEHFEAGLPKRAYDDFLQTREFIETYRNVTRMIAKAYEAAVTEVAILPFENGTRMPGLGRALTDAYVAHVAEQLGTGALRFTRMVASDRLYGVMTVAQMDRPAAYGARVAERVGADRYVVGRIGDLTTETHTGLVHTTVWRKRSERDSSGRTSVRYVAVPFDAVTRRREVKVSWEFDVVDAETGHVLTHRGNDVIAEARTVYTLFSADGGDDDFCVAPPDGYRPANVNAERAQEAWQESFGSWTLPKLLEHSRTHRNGRTRYRPDFRAEFSPRRMTRPVFLDDLPPADDLAYVALEDVWEPLFDSLRELDARD